MTTGQQIVVVVTAIITAVLLYLIVRSEHGRRAGARAAGSSGGRGEPGDVDGAASGDSDHAGAADGQRSGSENAAAKATAGKGLDETTKMKFVEAANEFISANNAMHAQVNASADSAVKASAVDAMTPTMNGAVSKMRTVAGGLDAEPKDVADRMITAAEAAVGYAVDFKWASNRGDHDGAARAAAGNDKSIAELNAAVVKWKGLVTRG